MALAVAPAREETVSGHMRAAERAPQLPALTGLRFVAAFIVVVSHFTLSARLPLLLPPHGILAWPARLAANADAVGNLGVDFFFILSGFILAYMYLTPAGALRCTRRAFWVARAGRILPLYLFAWVATAALAIYGHEMYDTPVVTGLSSLTLTQAWLPRSAIAFNPPGWSLSAEVFFYATFPTFAMALARLSPRALVRAAVLLSFVFVAPALALQVFAPNDSYWQGIVYFNPLLRLPEFLLGVVAGRLFVTTPTCRVPRCTLALTVLVMGTAAAGSPLLPRHLLHNGLLTPAFAVIIYGVACATRDGARTSALVLWGTAPLVTLGEASYALYILHWPMLDLFTRLVGGAPPPGGVTCITFFCAYLALTVAVSVLAWRCVETPARRAIRARWG